MLDRMTKGVIAKELENVPCIANVTACEEYDVITALENIAVQRRIMQVVSGKNKILNIKEDILEDGETITLLVKLININKSNRRGTELY